MYPKNRGCPFSVDPDSITSDACASTSPGRGHLDAEPAIEPGDSFANRSRSRVRRDGLIANRREKIGEPVDQRLAGGSKIFGG